MEIDVPAGRHHLAFEYLLFDAVDKAGNALSIIGLVLLLIVSFAPIPWFAVLESKKSPIQENLK